MKNSCFLILLMAVALWSGLSWAQEKPVADSGYVDQAYPRLASGILTYAQVRSLPEKVLLQAEGLEITAAEVDRVIAAQPEAMQATLRKNAFFVLEQEATGRLLRKLADPNAMPSSTDAPVADDSQVIQNFFDSLTKDIQIAEGDVETFYKENEGLFCGTPLDKVRSQIASYVLQDKKQRFVDQYIRNLGQTRDILLSESWTKAQADAARDNPLDQARAGGKMTLAVFSAASCCGPDKMKPVLETLKGKHHADSLNILYLEAKQEQILAARYQVRSIPTQIFFDKAGNEVYRHTGFFSAEDIEKQLAKIGTP